MGETACTTRASRPRPAPAPAPGVAPAFEAASGWCHEEFGGFGEEATFGSSSRAALVLGKLFTSHASFHPRGNLQPLSPLLR